MYLLTVCTHEPRTRNHEPERVTIILQLLPNFEEIIGSHINLLQESEKLRKFVPFCSSRFTFYSCSFKFVAHKHSTKSASYRSICNFTFSPNNRRYGSRVCPGFGLLFFFFVENWLGFYGVLNTTQYKPNYLILKLTIYFTSKKVFTSKIVSEIVFDLPTVLD